MKNTDQSADRYIDLKTLSAYSSLSVSTIRDYLSNSLNPIPSYCIRRKILIKKSEFDRWMDRHRVDNKRIDNIVNDIVNEFTELH
jgi:predicted DNA-binding transcriptional regulator AlpA